MEPLTEAVFPALFKACPGFELTKIKRVFQIAVIRGGYAGKGLAIDCIDA